MLPEFLVGGYRQYKQDTKFVATWLASTARSTGYSSQAVPPEIDPSAQDSNSVGKNKSKPKTKQQKRDAARRIPKERRQYVIAIQEFLPLAQHIKLNLTAPSRVPASVLAAIRRVIEARSAANEWFEEQNKNSEEDGHAHFIRILTLVKDILEPMTGVEEVAGQESGDDVTLVDNMFEGLEIQDVSKQFLDLPGIRHKDHSTAREMIGAMEWLFSQVNEKLEEQMAASALFRDIHKIYDHIHQTWLQHKEGKIELMAASIISNTGIDLIRRLEEDFFQQFPQFYKVDEDILKQFKRYDPKHKDAQQLLNVMFRARTAGQGMSPGHELFDIMPFKAEHYGTARYLFFDILYCFMRYYQGSQSMTKVVYNAPPGGPWNPTGDYSGMNATQKFRADNEILAELLPDLTLLSTSLSGIPTLAEDEVLRGARSIFPHGEGDEEAKGTKGKRKFQPKAHIWWLVSLRLFCDIHHILGPEIGKPFESVRRLGQNFKRVLQECFRLRDSGSLQLWPATKDSEIKRNSFDRIHQSLFVDEVKEFIDDAARNVQGWKGRASFGLLRRHPLVCGLMEFNIRACMHETGMIAILATSSGTTTAHLFNALKKEGLCNADWRDLETFIELYGESAIFGEGTRPNNVQDYATRFYLTRGVSIQTFAVDRRNRGIIPAKNKHHYLPGPPSNPCLLSVLNLRHCPLEQHREFTDEECKQVLEVLEEALDTKYLLVSNEGHVIVQHRSADAAAKRSESKLYNLSKYTPVELLMTLQFGLSQVLPTMRFDYLAFHKSCWNVLTSVSEEYPLLEQQILPLKYIGTEQSKVLLAVAPVMFVLAMGMPLARAAQMIRKCKVPHLPEVTLSEEHRKLYDQQAILKGMGKLIESKVVNGRLRVIANVQARKSLAMRPQEMLFERMSPTKDQKLTVQGHKFMLHTNSRCTKALCVCGAKSKPMLRPSWKKDLLDSDFGKGMLEALEKAKQEDIEN